MPFDSNGVFTRVMNWTQDRQNHIAIECGRHDQEDDNFAQGFNDCFCRDGRAAATGNFNLGNNKIQNIATGTASTDAVNKGQMDSAINTAKNSVTTAYQNYVKTVLSTIYPVGSVYIGTQNSCPMASLITGSTWTLVSKGKALWTGNGNAGSGTTTNANYANAPANTTISAGLPNITGKFGARCLMNNTSGQVEDGALYRTSTTDSQQAAGGDSWSGNEQAIGFDASRSNNIYSKSSTVQPPAYVVNVWRRTA
jgi:hypothetical protein